MLFSLLSVNYCSFLIHVSSFFCTFAPFLAKPLSDRERAQGGETENLITLKRRMLRCNSLNNQTKNGSRFS